MGRRTFGADRSPAKSRGQCEQSCQDGVFGRDNTPTQLLDVENDLIAGFYTEHRKAPLWQFGPRAESPGD